MDKRAIGVFDSGLGGLTAVKELEELMPYEDIVYFGDTGRVPYGAKSPDTVIRYSKQIITFLKSKNVKAILAACGTVSSTASETGKNSGIPYFDVIEPTAKAAMDATESGRIGIVGTTTTIKSGSYRNYILRTGAQCEVFEQACPMFVPLVENGYISPQDEVTRLVAERSLSSLRAKDIDTLILGCTHFPIITPTISSVIGDNVTLINSGKEAAKALCAYIVKENMENAGNESRGIHSYYVSDEPASFSNVAEIFLGHSLNGTIEKVDIENY